jgi:methionine aminopeptidase
MFRILLKNIIDIVALEKAISLCVDGTDVSSICGTVENFIEEELQKVFSNKKSKKLERGIAFPCCISVNKICGRFSPTQDDSIKLKTEDVEDW